MSRNCLCILLAASMLPPLLHAAPFERATMTIVVNDVALGSRADGDSRRPAKIADTITAESFLLSGNNSRAERRFPDDSLVRVGQNTVFSFAEGSRTLSLKKGAALFFMPKGSAPTTFKTATLTAAITGSAPVGFVVLGPGDRIDSEGIGSAEPGGNITVEGRFVPPGNIFVRTYNADGTYTDELLPYDPTTGLLYNMAALPFRFDLTLDLDGLKIPDLDELVRLFEQFERSNIDPRGRPEKKVKAPKPKKDDQEDPPENGNHTY